MSTLKTVLTTVVGTEARKFGKGNGFVPAIVSLVAARIAMRSIPGALIVGGALIAKKLYDEAKARDHVPAADVIIDMEAKEKNNRQVGRLTHHLPVSQ